MFAEVDRSTLMAWRGLLSCWDAWVLTFVLAVVVPTLGCVRFRQLLAGTSQGVTSRMKLTFYARAAGSQWLLVVVMLLVLGRHGLSAGDAGLRLGDPRVTWSVTGGLLIILAAVSWIVLRRVRRPQPAAPPARVSRLRSVMPGFGLEMAGFAVVCLTAGFCEEMLYRGWLVNFLRAVTGSTWTALVAAVLIFGIGHAYQGVQGILRTAFVGFQLAMLYVMVGSLIPGQILHAGVDLLVGVAGALSLKHRPPPSNESVPLV